MVSQLEKMYKLKAETANTLYGGKCYVCEKRYGLGFTFHHLQYFFNEKSYRDFKNTVDYNNYIIPIVKDNPDRFLLVCTNCHRTIEKLKQRKKPNRIRLLLALWNTK